MVNYLAVFVAAIAAYAVGALWYGPLFGKQWRKLQGFEGNMKPGGMSIPQSMIGGFIATFVMAYVLALSIAGRGITTVHGALMLSFWIWLGFVAAIMVNMVFYEKKPWTLYFINVFHYLVAIAIAAIILAVW